MMQVITGINAPHLARVVTTALESGLTGLWMTLQVAPEDRATTFPLSCRAAIARWMFVPDVSPGVAFRGPSSTAPHSQVSTP